VARSANFIVAAVVILAATGCTTTQQEAARLRVNSARLRQTEFGTRISAGNRHVAVSSVALVHRAGSYALVVSVRNVSTTAVSDLPMLVGYTVGHHRAVYLNAAPGVEYFQSHLPGIAAHGRLRWVLVSARRVPPHARLFARVGPADSAAPTLPSQLPRLSVNAEAGGAGQLRLRVINRSSVPQYELQVYAVAYRGSRIVGAGAATVEQLASGSSEPLTLRVIGNAVDTQLAVAAPPTIFG
jgi:hypothetical protein